MKKEVFIGSCLLSMILFASCGEAKLALEEHPKPTDDPDVCENCLLIESAADLQALTLIAGDTVWMKAGNWTDQELVFQGEGTVAKPIVLIAEEPGSVILNGSSSLSITGEWLVVDGLLFQGGYTEGKNVIDLTSTSANCRITNTAVIDYNPLDETKDYRWVSINGSHHRIDHCYLKGKAHQGPTMVVWGTSKPMYHRIDHNFFGERASVPDNGGETIRVGTSDWSMTDAFVTVEENIFFRCNGETEIISNKMGADTIRNNLFFESEGTLCLRHGNGSVVNGNYFIGNGLNRVGGVRIIGEDHLIFNNYFQRMGGTGQRSAMVLMDGVPNSALSGYFQVKNVKVVGNTMVNCRQAFDIGAGKGGSNRILPPIDSHVANNVVQQPVASTLVSFTDTPINFTYQGNLVYEVPSSVVLPNGFTRIDPTLVPTAEQVYEPTSNSPVWGAFQGNYPFYSSSDAGAQVLDTKHRNLLEGDGIGPDFIPGLGNQIVINP